MQKQSQICRFIQEQTPCPYKDSCRYLHPGQKTNKVFIQQVDKRNLKNLNKSSIELSTLEKSTSSKTAPITPVIQNQMVTDHDQFKPQKGWRNQIKTQAKKVTFQSISEISIPQEPEISITDTQIEDLTNKSIIEATQSSRKIQQTNEYTQQSSQETDRINVSVIEQKIEKDFKKSSKIDKEEDQKTQNLSFKKQIEKQLKDQYESIESISQDLTLVVKKKEIILYQQLEPIIKEKIDLNEQFKVQPYKKIPETNTIVKLFYNQENKQLYIILLDINLRNTKLKLIREVQHHLTYYNSDYKLFLIIVVNINRVNIGFFSLPDKKNQQNIQPSLVREYPDQILSFAITSTDKSLFINHPDKKISQEELSKICKIIHDKHSDSEVVPEQNNSIILSENIKQNNINTQKQQISPVTLKKVTLQSFTSESDSDEDTNEDDSSKYLKTRNPTADVFKYLSGNSNREDDIQAQKNFNNCITNQKNQNKGKKEKEIVLYDKENSNSASNKSDSQSQQFNANQTSIQINPQNNILNFDDDEFFVESDQSMLNQQKSNEDKKKTTNKSSNTKEKSNTKNKSSVSNNQTTKKKVKNQNKSMIVTSKQSETISSKKQINETKDKKQVINPSKPKKEEKKEESNKQLLTNQDQNKDTDTKVSKIKETKVHKTKEKSDFLKINDSYEKDVIMIEEELFPESPVNQQKHEQQKNKINQDSNKQIQGNHKQNSIKQTSDSQNQDLNKSCMLVNRLKIESNRKAQNNFQQESKQTVDINKQKQELNKLLAEIQTKQNQEQTKQKEEQNLRSNKINKEQQLCLDDSIIEEKEQLLQKVSKPKKNDLGMQVQKKQKLNQDFKKAYKNSSRQDIQIYDDQDDDYSQNLQESDKHLVVHDKSKHELSKPIQISNKQSPDLIIESKERNKQDSKKQKQELQQLNSDQVKESQDKNSQYHQSNKQIQEFGRASQDHSKFLKEKPKQLQDQTVSHQDKKKNQSELTKNQDRKNLPKYQQDDNESNQDSQINKQISSHPQSIKQKESKKPQSLKQSIDQNSYVEDKSIQQSQSSFIQDKQPIKKVNEIFIDGKKIKIVKYLKIEDEQPIKQKQDDTEIVNSQKQLNTKVKVHQKEVDIKEKTQANDVVQQQVQQKPDKISNNSKNVVQSSESKNNLERSKTLAQKIQKQINTQNVSSQNNESQSKTNQKHKLNQQETRENYEYQKQSQQINQIFQKYNQNIHNKQFIQEDPSAILIDDDENEIQQQQMKSQKLKQNNELKTLEQRLTEPRPEKNQNIGISIPTVNQKFLDNIQIIKQKELPSPLKKQQEKPKVNLEVNQQIIEEKSFDKAVNDPNQQKPKKKIIINNKVRQDQMNKEYYDKFNQANTKKIVSIDNQQVKGEQIPLQQQFQDNSQKYENTYDIKMYNMNYNSLQPQTNQNNIQISLTPQELQQFQIFSALNQSSFNMNYMVQNPHTYNNFLAELEKVKIFQQIQSMRQQMINQNI